MKWKQEPMVEKFSVNFSELQQQLRPKKPAYKYADVKDRLVKVAFDVVRFMDADNIDGLWQIQETDDGEVIVAMYDESSAQDKPTEKTAGWSAMPDRAGNVNVFYHETPVAKVSLASLGMTDEDPGSVGKTLSEKLALNSSLRVSFLGTLSREDREALFRAYPELKG